MLRESGSRTGTVGWAPSAAGRKGGGRLKYKMSTTSLFVSSSTVSRRGID